MMVSENPTDRDRSKHVDVKVHCLRDLVRDGHVNRIKCAGTQIVSDTLTKTLSQPVFGICVGNSCPLSTSRFSLGLSRLR